MAGREMTRLSSFDRMMSMVANTDSTREFGGATVIDVNNAATELQLWWLRQRKILQTIAAIKVATSDVLLISEKLTMVKENSSSFDEVRKILSASNFTVSFTSFLSLLPLDPTLKAKNSFARSIKTIGSALFIHFFPGEVLLDDESIDESREAEECSMAASILVMNLYKFISSCAAVTSDAVSRGGNALTFRARMLSYRFAVRNFIEKLEQWKELDASRLLQSLESPYLESYTMFYSLSKVVNITDASSRNSSDSANSSLSPHVTESAIPSSTSGSVIDSDENETNLIVYRAAEQQCSKIREAMVKVLGPRAQTKIEELEAHVEAILSGSTEPNQPSGDDGGVGAGGIKRIENSGAGSMSSATADVVATSLPKRFQEISLVLRRVAAAGGFETAVTGSTNTVSPGGSDLMLGSEQHRLMHEICLDPTYRLPEATSPGAVKLEFYSKYYIPSLPGGTMETGGWTHMIISPYYPRSSNGPDPQALALTLPSQTAHAHAGSGGMEGTPESNLQKLKNKMKSTMLFMMDDNIVRSLSQSPIPDSGLQEIVEGCVVPVMYNMGDTIMILSAMVVATHRESEVLMTMDVEYLCDKALEKGVPLGRVKTSSDMPSPTPFLLALQDSFNRIAALTPNRADLHAELTASVDFQLWMQMLTHGAMTVSDVTAIVMHLFSCITKLQAPARSEDFTAWTSAYNRLLSSSSDFESVIPLLPLVFEFVGAAIEEIKRDIANYHVTTLAPLSRPPLGPSYLSHSLVTALLTHGTMPGTGMSLDNTVSLLVSILSPVQKQKEVAAELLEATGEALDINDLGIVTSAPSSTVPPDETNALPTAASTPTVTVAPTVTASSSSSSVKVGINTAVTAVCMLRLLQLPVRLNSPSARALVLPETFCFDGQRLSLLRDLVDILSVQCTVMITIRQALQKIGLLSSEAEETTLYQRLNVLLRDSSVGMKDILAEAVRFVRVAKEASRARVASLPAVDTNRSTSPAAVRYLSPLGSIDDAPAPRSRPVSPARATRAAEWETAASEWEEAMEKSLKNVLADGNPVLQLFTKRIYKVLLRAVLGQPYLNKLPSLSLHAKGIQRNLSELIASAVKLFALHNSAYGDVYSMIFSSHTFQHHVFPPVETDVD